MPEFNFRTQDARRDQWLSQSIDQLLYDDAIDTRTANVAKRAGITTLEGVLSCFLKNGKSFKHFEFSGKKVDALISDLLREGIHEFGFDETELLDGIDYRGTSPLLIEAENSFLVGELSATALAATKRIWRECGRTVEGFFLFLNDAAGWKEVAHIDADVIKELEDYWPTILPNLISRTDILVEWQEDLLGLVGKHFCGALPAAFQYLTEGAGFPFDLAMVLFQALHPLGDRDYSVHESYHEIDDLGEAMTMEAIGERHALTRERIRQIVHQIQETVYAFLARYHQVFEYYCQMQIPSEYWDRDCFVVDENELLVLVPSQRSVFFIDYRMNFLTLALSRRFVLLETNCDGFGIFVRGRLLEHMNWHAIQNHILAQRHSSAAKDYSTTVSEICAQFINAETSGDYYPRIRLILNRLLEKCIGMKLGLDGRYRFRLLSESGYVRVQIVQQLLESSEPTHFNDLFERVGRDKNFPDLDLKQMSMILREIPQAKSLGLSGYYYHVDNSSKVPPLGPWSTFEELIISYLRKAGAPEHISILAEHVQFFRKTDRKSVASTLVTLVDTSLKYQGGGYWGLKGQSYSAVRFRNVPMHTYRIVDRILNRRQNHEIDEGELSKLLQAELQLTAVQVNDWLESRVASGKLLLAGGKICKVG